MLHIQLLRIYSLSLNVDCLLNLFQNYSIPDFCTCQNYQFKINNAQQGSQPSPENITSLRLPLVGPVPHELVTPAAAGHVYYDFPQAAGINFQTPHNTKHPGSARGPPPEVGIGFLQSGRIVRLR